MQNSKRRIFWAYLLERQQSDFSADNLSMLTESAAKLGAVRLRLMYTRTDFARNLYELAFLNYSENPDDLLVMLDQDHVHPFDIIERLAARNVGVVGALAFRRSEPWSPCCFIRDEEGNLNAPEVWDGGMERVNIAGTGAIAIQRWVFGELLKQGFGWPHFRYEYRTDPNPDLFDEKGELKPKVMVVNGYQMPSEDIYFSELCEKANVPVFIDFDVITPHLTTSVVDGEYWKEWLRRHPDPKEYLDFMSHLQPMRSSQALEEGRK